MVKKCLFVAIIIVFAIIGCEEEMTPKVISDLIFNRGIEHAEVLQNSQFRDLTPDEIEILKSSISDGREMSELDGNDLSSSNLVDYYQFIITKKNKSIVRINYNLKEKYILLPKIQVHQERTSEYKKQFNTYKKYLNGTYKLYPSSTIEMLTKRLETGAK